MDVHRLGMMVGSVEVPDGPIGQAVQFLLPDGEKVQLAVSRYRSHPPRLQVRLVRMEVIRKIPTFNEFVHPQRKKPL